MGAYSYLPIAVAMVLAASASVTGAIFAADRIEKNAFVDLTQAFAAAETDWISVDVDGLQVTLTGLAPDEAARFDALSVAGSVVDATRVVDQMEVEPGRAIEAPDFSLEILRNLDGISLIGLVPASQDRAELLERIGRLSNGAPVTDLLEAGEYPVPGTWEPALEFALTALADLPRSKVSISHRRVAITAIVEDSATARRTETVLARRAPPGLALALDISAPRPAIAPFIARFLIDEDGARFDACSADTEAARDRILSAAIAAGMLERAECQIGLGAPSLAWADAVSSGIGALARLGGGKITFSDADVTLIALDSAGQADFDREVGELERALPEGFSLHAVLPEPVEVDGTGEEGAAGAPEFVASRNEDGAVQLRGRIADARSRSTVESFAQARFGVARVTGAPRLDADLPEGWSLRVLAGLDALSHLHNGRVVVQPDFVSVTGETGSTASASDIAQVLTRQLGDGANYELDVRYVEELDPLAGLPTPEECVEQLNAVLAIKKVTFEPGSADLDADASETIDKLAEILKGCRSAEMEIAGHTDSQGRESMNQRLSQARATAVLEAIMARRVLTSNLTARGYGEANPIADNET
ncbi:MAG: OmpA family protein, partial [Pseudomonadota bacterium]